MWSDKKENDDYYYDDFFFPSIHCHKMDQEIKLFGAEMTSKTNRNMNL